MYSHPTKISRVLSPCLKVRHEWSKLSEAELQKYRLEDPLAILATLSKPQGICSPFQYFRHEKGFYKLLIKEDFTENQRKIIKNMFSVFWFGLMLNVPVNNYGHVGTVSSPYPHFLPGQARLSG